jgi:putative N6-adenine-specific DNA methylase
MHRDFGKEMGRKAARMYEYQKNGRFFAQVAHEMRGIASEELSFLGATDIKPVHRGIHFKADTQALYQIAYGTHLVSRILAPLMRFKCHAPRYLYKRAREVAWPELFPVDRTFALFSSVSNSQIRHSRYASLKLKDAIVDTFRKETGKRPDVDRKSPDVWIGLHIENNMATISLDVSGGSLHRRGYREMSVEAPMQETLAAAIIRISRWDGSRPLYDPMCGSGTLLCEALMSYCNVPSAFLREKFGFEWLPGFNRKRWIGLRTRIDKGIRALPTGLIGGSDISPDAARAAGANRLRLPEGRRIRIGIKDFRDLQNLENTTIVCNPPYGVRMGKGDALDQLYRDMGDFLKQHCRGSSAFIYFGKPELIPAIHLRPAWKKPLKNGGLDGRLVRFDMY